MTTKRCANRICGKEFEPEHGNQTYCCTDCQKRRASSRYYAAHKEECKARHKKWADEHPEAAKAIEHRKQVGHYRTGKLPPWMYS